MTAIELAAYHATQRSLAGDLTDPRSIGGLAYDAGVAPSKGYRYSVATHPERVIRFVLRGYYTVATARVMADTLRQAGLRLNTTTFHGSFLGRTTEANYRAILSAGYGACSFELVRELLRHVTLTFLPDRYSSPSRFGSMYILMKHIQASDPTGPCQMIKYCSSQNVRGTLEALHRGLREEFIAAVMLRPDMRTAKSLKSSFDAPDLTCMALAMGHCTDMENWDEMRTALLAQLPHAAGEVSLRNFDKVVAVGSGAPPCRQMSCDYVRSRLLLGELETLSVGAISLYLSHAALCPALIALMKMWLDACEDCDFIVQEACRGGAYERLHATLVRRLLTEPYLDDIEDVHIPECKVTPPCYDTLEFPPYEAIAWLCESSTGAAWSPIRLMAGETLCCEMLDFVALDKPVTLTAAKLAYMVEHEPMENAMYIIKTVKPKLCSEESGCIIDTMMSSSYPNLYEVTAEFCIEYETRIIDILRSINFDYNIMTLERAEFYGSVLRSCVDPATLRDSMKRQISTMRKTMRQAPTPNALDDWLQLVTVPIV